MTDSQELLAEYATSGSEAAFRELLTRYLNLVYSTAARLVSGDTHLAEDVTQTVFIDLARTARSLPRGVMVGGWLHRHTCYVGRKALRGERRRQLRERQAVEMNSLQDDHSESNLAQVAPVLDEAIDALGAEDRTAILLRFFEQLDLRAVGDALGSSEDAARKRVTRALDKLQLLLKRRGMTMSAAAIGTGLAAQAVTAAPAGVAASIAGTALASAAAGGGITLTLLKIMSLTKLQAGIIGAILVGSVATPLVIQHHAQIKLREKDHVVLRQVEQLAQVTAENERLSKLLAQANSAESLSQDQKRELLKLRGEVGRLRGESLELAKLKSEGPSSGTESEEEYWLKRIRLLKQRLEQTPEAKIPELQFLTEDDWLSAAKHHLDTDEDYSAAFSDLRRSAAGNFLRTVETALHEYLVANNGQFPTDVAQLKPFFKTPPGDDLLQRYQIVPASSVPQANVSGNAGDWLITLKSKQDGGNWAISRNGVNTGMSTWGDDSRQLTTILAPAMKALFDATPVINGRRSVDIHQLPPYLTTPEQKAAYEQLMQGSK